MKRKLSFIASALLSFLIGGCMAGYNVSEPSLVSDGLKVKNLLYQPSVLSPDRKYPGVVINHGGMEGAEFETRGLARELAVNGFVVVLPQFRGEGGSEGHFEFSGGEVDDSLAALGYLKALGYVDAGRIGMVGYSLGGLVTLNVLERDPGVKAAVLMGAISDPLAFFEETSKKRPPESPAQIERHKKDMQDRSPMGGLEKVNASVLILHGARDTRVNPEQSKRLYEMLKASGKDVEIKIYPYIGHSMLWYDRPVVETVEFLKVHLNYTSRSH
jgi:dipeptidyl aminopeptidase/acylaminoacyl peptidase